MLLLPAICTWYLAWVQESLNSILERVCAELPQFFLQISVLYLQRLASSLQHLVLKRKIIQACAEG